MTVAQNKAARRRMLARYGAARKARSIAEAMRAERIKAERAAKAKGK